MKNILTIILLMIGINAVAQEAESPKDEAWKKIYRATATKVNDLVHTKLDVHFNYAKSWMYGKAWITLHPHFYATDSLNLDAKGMLIEEVSLVSGGKNSPLRYTYDSMNLRIVLNRVYKANENYTVYIKYTAKPNEYKADVYSLMPGEKGLYFINPLGNIKGKPTQIWTQGETEGNSFWVPTIDKPNQKTTQEIIMTVPENYVTLSNGLLASQKLHKDGTRTDTWKMDLPYAPYLMFMGVGEYAIIKDKYKNKEVSYYVEKEYAPYARKIFGHTPEMIAYFSTITGVDFPWPKYAQITGRDYIFGAMENTSATLHEESSQQDARQLLDGNAWEEVIVHELFHQWFGDYVTTESWSNTTVNESFADYSETIWNEYKYGKEAGQAAISKDLRNYLGNPANTEVNLVRFNYKNVFEVFDAVSYQKGGCILHMLRNLVGDSAFFKSLNLYLTTHKFKSGEAQNLRLAFEEITGQDLNWFFNQWYYNNGHPKLDISYSYDAGGKSAKVVIKQTQAGNPFRLPFAIDIYEGQAKKRYQVWMNNATDSFSFATNTKPDLINVDAEKILVCEKTDHKTPDNFIFQYQHAGSYIDRREAISFFINHKEEPKRIAFLQNALKDNNEILRSFVLQRINISNDTIQKAFLSSLNDISKNDPKALVRADAIEDLGYFKQMEFKPFFIKAVADSSYTIAGKALEALEKIDSTEAMNLAKQLSKHPAKGALQTTICTVLSKYGEAASLQYIYQQFEQSGINGKFNLLEPLSVCLSREPNAEILKQQVDHIISLRNEVPGFIMQFVAPLIDGTLTGIAATKEAAGARELSDYIKVKMAEK